MYEEKNIKNTARAAEAFGLSWSFCLSVPESKLSHNTHNIHGDVPSLSRSCGKNLASLKNNLVLWYPMELKEVQGTMFFSAKRDVFASDAVCVSERNHWWLVRSARACSQAQPNEATMRAVGRRQKLRGFYCFC